MPINHYMRKGSLAFKSDPPVGNFTGMDQDTYPTVSIRLKPYLQEYLRCKLQEAELTAWKNSLIGSMLRPFLEITKKEQIPVFHHKDENWITFRLPLYHDLEVRRHSVTISEENMAYFANSLEAHFKDFFFSYMDDKVRYTSNTGKRGAIKKCIIQFCADMHISYNYLNYEMLKKSYYRRRNEIQKKPSFFASKLSLRCPLIFLL